jgi:hypothetical protein
MTYDELKAYFEAKGYNSLKPLQDIPGSGTEIELTQATIDLILDAVKLSKSYREIKKTIKQDGKAPSTRQINVIKTAWLEALAETGGQQ